MVKSAVKLEAASGDGVAAIILLSRLEPVLNVDTW